MNMAVGVTSFQARPGETMAGFTYSVIYTWNNSSTDARGAAVVEVVASAYLMAKGMRGGNLRINNGGTAAGPLRGAYIRVPQGTAAAVTTLNGNLQAAFARLRGGRTAGGFTWRGSGFAYDSAAGRLVERFRRIRPATGGSSGTSNLPVLRPEPAVGAAGSGVRISGPVDRFVLPRVRQFIEDRARGELLTPPNNNLETVPSIRNGEFERWFDALSTDEINKVWADPILRDKIKDRLRAPGGYHEWCLVSRADVFKNWGISASQIRDLRTKISDVQFVNPDGVHGGRGSTTAHNELLDIIDSSQNYAEFRDGLREWADRRLKGGVDALPEGLR